MSKSKRSLSQALNTGVRKYGTAIISNLAIAIKTTQLYSFAHQNVVQALKELEEYLTSFIQLEGEAEISRIEDFLFINEVRIKVDLGGLQTFDFVLDLLKARDIGCLAFSDGVSSVELSTLIDVLTRQPPSSDDVWKWLEGEIEKENLPHIRMAKYEVRPDQRDELSEDKRMLAINLFFRAIHQLQETFEVIQNNRKMNLKRLKRTIQSIVDMLLEDEPTLLALTNIKDYGTRLANHSVNVTILSLALGARLGFSRKLLGDLGVAALLHDLGKLKVPGEVLSNEPETLTAEDRTAYEDHVYHGVEILLNQRIVDAVVKSMNVAFLHHFRFDSTGYPRTHLVKEQNFYSRIISVCDFFENKNAPRPGSGPSGEPDHIMRRLLDGSGTEFDALVVKAFVNLMGLFPIGCLVCLDTGELGTVIAPPSNPRHLDRPTVRLFADPNGNAVDLTVDLMEQDGGAFKRSILKLYQQEEVELDMQEFLSVI